MCTDTFFRTCSKDSDSGASADESKGRGFLFSQYPLHFDPIRALELTTHMATTYSVQYYRAQPRSIVMMNDRASSSERIPSHG